MPERIQLRRTKGWRMPANTVKVDRTTKWGNDFPVGGVFTDPTGQVSTTIRTRAQAVDLFTNHQAKGMAAAARVELAGKNLACWCPPGEACHADVLLRLANGGVS